MAGVETRHPQYTAARAEDWRLMRDAMDGEGAVKGRKEAYLPMPSGFRQQEDGGAKAYADYMGRATFPEILAPTVSGMSGIAHGKEIAIELPDALSYLWEDADGDGMPLEEFHRQITRELLVMGRHAVLADAPEGGGEPYLAAYCGESLINWDKDFYVLDESGPVRKGFDWENRTRFRVLSLQDGRYVQEIHEGEAPAFAGAAAPSALGQKALDFIPFAVASAVDLKPDIRTPPLIGVARAAKAIYQLDADERHQLFMSGQETLLVINGEAPSFVGAGACHVINTGDEKTGDMKYVSPSCSGIEAHQNKIKDVREAAVQAGAKLLDQSERAQESGEARKLRYQSETATLASIVRSGCALLEKGLRFVAALKGLEGDDITVPVPDTLLDSTMTPADAEALMRVWLEGGISYPTFYAALQKGGIASPERDDAEEYALIEKDRDRREGLDGDDENDGADGSSNQGDAQ